MVHDDVGVEKQTRVEARNPVERFHSEPAHRQQPVRISHALSQKARLCSPRKFILQALLFGVDMLLVREMQAVHHGLRTVAAGVLISSVKL